MGSNNAQFGNRKTKSGKNKYKQSFYSLQNPDKYIGILPIKCFSSWEYAFCKFCDLNNTVIKWSSESLEIPYITTNNNYEPENHRYYPDFYVEMLNTFDPDRYDRLVIEVKPKHETEAPKAPVKQTLKMLENYEYSLRTFKKNLHKWAFTKEWCEKRGLKFLIVTEDDLKKRGLIP